MSGYQHDPSRDEYPKDPDDGDGTCNRCDTPGGMTWPEVEAMRAAERPAEIFCAECSCCPECCQCDWDDDDEYGDNDDED
jgi:hypothetical protein